MVNIQGILQHHLTLHSLTVVSNLEISIAKLCTENTSEWDELLPFVLFTYREVPHEETSTV